MENIEFSNACYQVLEILKHVKEDDLAKIPEEEIQMLKQNANFNFDFKYNPNKDIKEQQVSKLAKGIIAVYFYRYTATDKQIEKIKLKQEYDLKKFEAEKREKYNSEILFKKEIKTEDKIKNEVVSENNNMQMIEYKKESWLTKLFNKIKTFFYK